MEMIFFLAVSPKGETRRLIYGGPTLEDCFETLTLITNKGWRLIHVELINKRSHVTLPVEAFDGVSLTEPLQALCQEWKMILV